MPALSFGSHAYRETTVRTVGDLTRYDLPIPITRLVMRQFWVTVELAPGRTQDRRISARSAWSAGWLFRHLHPGLTVRFIRPVPHQEA